VISLTKALDSIIDRGRKYFEVSNRYDAARQSDYVREVSVSSQGANADSHYDSSADLYRMSELGWELYRNNVIVAPTVDRLVANVLQSGFEIEPDVGARGNNEMVQDKWGEYVENKQACDVQGEFDFTGLSQIAFRDSVVAGDCVGLPLKTGQVQLVEYHRIRSPHGSTNFREGQNNVVHGVELDRNRRRVRYWITKDSIPPSQPIRPGDADPYEVYDEDGRKQLFHVWHPARSTQTRGVSKLVPCMDFARMYNDVHFARLVQQQAVSAYTFFRKRGAGFELPEGVEEETESVWDACQGTFKNLQDVSVGSMYTGYPEEEFSVLNSNVPNPTFFDHAAAIEQLIGLNLDLPHIVVKLDATATNFSGWRGVLEQAKIKFRLLQHWFGCSWYSPVYLFKLDQWSRPGSDLSDPRFVALRQRVGDRRFFKHEWIFPTWPYVDVAAEQAADVSAVGNNQNSMRRIQRQHGRRWSRVFVEIIEDKSQAIEAAIKTAAKLNGKYGTDVNPEQVKWSDLIAFPRPAGDNVSDSRDATIELNTETEDDADSTQPS
jgi:capsid protein